MRDHLRELLDTPYPWEAQTHLPVKLSVSELKRQKRLLEDVEQEELYQEETVIPLIPRFLQEQEETSGALRGDAYHHLMERLDFGTVEPEARGRAAGSGAVYRGWCIHGGGICAGGTGGHCQNAGKSPGQADGGGSRAGSSVPGAALRAGNPDGIGCLIGKSARRRITDDTGSRPDLSPDPPTSGRWCRESSMPFSTRTGRSSSWTIRPTGCTGRRISGSGTAFSWNIIEGRWSRSPENR